MQKIGPFALAGGALAVAAVFAGEAMQVPGFCTPTGFWGAHFLDGLSYLRAFRHGGEETAAGFLPLRGRV